MSDAIRFHKGHTSFGEFSNAFVMPFCFEGQVYVTAQHCIQAKMRDEELLGDDEEVAQVQSQPRLSADELTRRVVHAKFSQHAELRALLLSTGTRELIEDLDSELDIARQD
eukprot:4801985-Pyramimonas_sp.AAC.1